jgi:hypothetical protein
MLCCDSALVQRDKCTWYDLDMIAGDDLKNVEDVCRRIMRLACSVHELQQRGVLQAAARETGGDCSSETCCECV